MSSGVSFNFCDTEDLLLLCNIFWVDGGSKKQNFVGIEFVDTNPKMPPKYSVESNTNETRGYLFSVLSCDYDVRRIESILSIAENIS
ncbi:UNVERIFIED_CONTAM: hypothetical protein NCL1_23396 [Trichonephila clavipes]